MKIYNLEKHYENFSLKIKNLQLPPDTIYGVIGSNGSGKTTFVKLIAGLLKADSGQIDYEGLTPRDITMASRKPYFLHDTVYRNLVYPLKLRKIEPDREQIEFYLELAGLKDKRRQYAPSLSTGEQQKLSLVRALIFSPRLIVVDEAFSSLDIESAGAFERLILQRQQSRPAAWVIVSHQFSHIQRLCDRVLFMSDGRVQADGTPNDIFYHPANTTLQKYLQSELLRNETGL